MSKATVVILSSLHWHSTWQRHQDIATGLAAAGYDVIYVEPIPKRWPGFGEWQRVVGRLTGSASTAGYCHQEVPAGVRLVSPRTLPDVGALAQWANDRLFVQRLVRQIEALCSPQPLVVMNYLPLPASIAVQQALDPDVAIYDCVADWSAFPLTGSLTQSEEYLLAITDLVFADSPYLLQKMRQRHSNVQQLLPAVHYERFAAAQSGGRDPGQQPLCVYFGTLGYALDMDLLQAIGEKFPLRLIGPARAPLPEFNAAVELLGQMPHADVPHHLRDADVLLLPYDPAAPQLQAVIPAKTFECLATGIPTVVSGLCSLEAYADLFYLSDDPTHFVAQIEAAWQEDPGNRAARIACAKENSWAARIDEIDMVIQGMLGEKGAAAKQMPAGYQEEG